MDRFIAEQERKEALKKADLKSSMDRFIDGREDMGVCLEMSFKIQYG